MVFQLRTEVSQARKSLKGHSRGHLARPISYNFAGAGGLFFLLKIFFFMFVIPGTMKYEGARDEIRTREGESGYK